MKLNKNLLNGLTLLLTISSGVTLNSCRENDSRYYTKGLQFTILDDNTGYSVNIGEAKDLNITIPSIYKGKPVKVIDTCAFSECIRIKSVKIPDSIEKIEDFAFFQCKALKHIDIPSSVISIGRYAFSECRSLTNIVIPNSVTSIGSYAFYNCDSLTNIVIPKSVTLLEKGAFYKCESLSIFYEIPYSHELNWEIWADDSINAHYFYGGWEYDDNGIPKTK